jgi:serine/threonine-protein kinase
MQLQLVVTRGPDMGTIFELDMLGTYVLGREDDCSIQLSDPRISRHHCEIDVTGGKATLKDSNSAWGTIVNGEKVATHPLQPGDTIQLVETELRFEVATSAAAATWQPNQPRPDLKPPPAEPVSPPPRPELPAALEPEPAPAPQARPVAEGKTVARPGQELYNLVGTTLGRYEVVEVIAKARTGLLFRARDTEKDHQVALKVLWPEITRDEEEVQRFVRAVKTVLHVKHPNLVDLYGAGKTRPRYCWTASELVEGDSLMDVMTLAGQNGQLPWQQCLRVGIHIARALEAAAAAKMVHRNITPTNILIRKRDGVAKLGDLMLAKALEGTQAEKITRPGETVGDIPYLSPEQLLVDGELDSRSDIYSLGATLYSAVTGRPPIQGKSLAETISQIESQKPEDPQKLNPSLPRQFAKVILQMLEKDPEKRFATPTELVRSLNNVAVATDQPEVSLPDDKNAVHGELSWKSVSAMLRKVPRETWRKLIVGAALVILAVVLGVTVSSALSSSDGNSSDGTATGE